MKSKPHWELAAALAVLEQAQQEAAALRHGSGDPEDLNAAERRCGSARALVERIRSTLNTNTQPQCAGYAELWMGDVPG